MEITSVTAYECRHCGMIHEEFDTAASCCGPYTVDAYKCPVCGWLHEEEKVARTCCKKEVDHET